MLEDKPEVLTIQEVAEIFNVSIQTLRRWDNSGILKAFRANSTQQRRYKKSDVIKYLQTSPN